VRVVHETLKVANANKKNIAARGSTKIAMIFEICMHCPEHEQMTTCRKKKSHCSGAILHIQECAKRTAWLDSSACLALSPSELYADLGDYFSIRNPPRYQIILEAKLASNTHLLYAV
jgi:hypothetical protein